MCQELLFRQRILFEETGNEYGWLVEAATGLQCGCLGPLGLTAHGRVRATLLVRLDSVLHGRTAVKHYVNERGVWEDIGDGSKGRESAQ